MAGSKGRRQSVLRDGARAAGIILAIILMGEQVVLVMGKGSRSDANSSSGSSSSRTSSQGVIRAAWAGSSRADAAFPLLYLHFCLGCPDPAAEGSLVSALAPHHGIRDFKVSGDLVHAVPNKGNADVLLNGDDMTACVVLFERGEIPVVEKVLKAQAAGAVGVVVIDNGGCNDGFVDCGRLGGVRDRGFARRDGSHAWSGVKIPAVLVSMAQGERLRGMMRLQTVTVEGLGEQLVER